MTRRKIDLFDPSKFYVLQVPDRATAPTWTDCYLHDHETHNYYLRRVEARKRASVGGKWPVYDSYPLNDLEIDPADMRQSSTFECRKPSNLFHYLWLDADYEAFGYVTMTVVSRIWRDIIEYLEPGKHQFFPTSFASPVELPPTILHSTIARASMRSITRPRSSNVRQRATAANNIGKQYLPRGDLVTFACAGPNLAASISFSQRRAAVPTIMSTIHRQQQHCFSRYCRVAAISSPSSASDRRGEWQTSARRTL